MTEEVGIGVEERKKERIRELAKAVAPAYNGDELRFLARCIEHIAGNLDIAEEQRRRAAIDEEM